MKEEDKYKKAIVYGSLIPLAILILVAVAEATTRQKDIAWLFEFILCFAAMILFFVLEKAYVKPEIPIAWILVVAASMFVGGIPLCIVVHVYTSIFYYMVNPWSKGVFSHSHWGMYLLTLFIFEFLWFLIRILAGIIGIKIWAHKKNK